MCPDWKSNPCSKPASKARERKTLLSCLRTNIFYSSWGFSYEVSFAFMISERWATIIRVLTVFITSSYAEQSVVTAKIPVITNKMLSQICRLDLKQEAIPEDSHIKILKNHEVSVSSVFNHLACVQTLSNSIFISPEVFY